MVAKICLFMVVILLNTSLVSAQQRHHRLAITLGPNRFHERSEEWLADQGWTMGGAYIWAPRPQWAVSLGANLYNWQQQRCALVVSAPNGPKVRSGCVPVVENAWQGVLGLRVMSKPKRWRWYGEVEAGMLRRFEREKTIRWTAGAMGGVERRLGMGPVWLALQPYVQYFQAPVTPLARRTRTVHHWVTGVEVCAAVDF